MLTNKYKIDTIYRKKNFLRFFNVVRYVEGMNQNTIDKFFKVSINYFDYYFNFKKIYDIFLLNTLGVNYFTFYGFIFKADAFKLIFFNVIQNLVVLLQTMYMVFYLLFYIFFNIFNKIFLVFKLR